MADLYLTAGGNVAISPGGDLAMTDTHWRDDIQQAYIRTMTDEGDYLLYPRLGASLSRLHGMPQSPETAEYGKRLIADALDREGRFENRTYYLNAVPIGPSAIRFDITIRSGSTREMSMSIEQDLGLE